MIRLGTYAGAVREHLLERDEVANVGEHDGLVERFVSENITHQNRILRRTWFGSWDVKNTLFAFVRVS